MPLRNRIAYGLLEREALHPQNTKECLSSFVIEGRTIQGWGYIYSMGGTDNSGNVWHHSAASSLIGIRGLLELAKKYAFLLLGWICASDVRVDSTST